MICEQCNKELPEKDFLANQKICYRCVYRNKTKNVKKLAIHNATYCRICEKEIVLNEYCKVRQRTVFCSWECAEVGHKDQTMNHWTRKLRHLDLPY